MYGKSIRKLYCLSEVVVLPEGKNCFWKSRRFPIGICRKVVGGGQVDRWPPAALPALACVRALPRPATTAARFRGPVHLVQANVH